ncbi:MAG: hypothetical protein HOH55_05040 [Candidatus Marinimicrobia bacterium]|jgi:hypothetical protein|nr:hypothetical protein [Candidatus Neomarinimicrobiota bacterium]
MAALDKEKKSSRLLASRRYTHETLNASQESFTEVLDLGASEIYTEAGLIPSSGLPYSGSTQIHSTYSTEGKSVMKYWYRQRLTKSNTNNEVWFFLDPTGSDSGIGAQLISDDQTVNFISPKYSIAGLATSTTEDSTPGYLATLLKSTSLDSSSLDGDDIVSTNDYTFDYKTGVVQFTNSSVDPGNSDYLYMTVYQYVGSTLASGNISGSATSTGSFGRLEVGELSITDDLTYGSTNWNESGGALSVTGSDFFWKSTGGGFDIYDNSDALMFKIENKVAILGARTTTPTATAGGIYYSGSDDFYFGYENEVS